MHQQRMNILAKSEDVTAAETRRLDRTMHRSMPYSEHAVLHGRVTRQRETQTMKKSGCSPAS